MEKPEQKPQRSSPDVEEGRPCSAADRKEGNKRRKIRVALIHSEIHTQVLYEAMNYIHKDRDILLEALLDCCGFLQQTPRFLSIIEPKRASRKHLERFHDAQYLDLLEFILEEHEYENVKPLPSLSLLDLHGLTEDCPIPPQPARRAALWDYCLHVAGGSLHAAQLLVSGKTEVALHWGGGRHHAHSNRAAGFCYVNDAVLSIKHMQRRMSRILYIDIDIHHADGVQDAFYDTDQVMTVSFHRHSKGFFPATGSTREKGVQGTPGVGYNLNIPLPPGCSDQDFIAIYQHAIGNLMNALNPEAVVLCVGADNLKGDPLVGQTDGWSLTPEGLAKCTRYTSHLCRDIKLLVLGGGGYHPARTARAFLLCTAAACEAARPGLLNELPRDIPRHEHFARYGPDFRLLYDHFGRHEAERRTVAYDVTLAEARKEIDTAVLYLQAQKKKKDIPEFGLYKDEEDYSWSSFGKKALQNKGRRRK